MSAFDPITLSVAKKHTDEVARKLETTHINIAHYDEEFLSNLFTRIQAGETDFRFAIANSDALWEAINASSGEIWFDVPLPNGPIYTSRVSGLTRKRGEIGWIDTKMATWDGTGWQILYFGFGGAYLNVKVEEFPGVVKDVSERQI